MNALTEAQAELLRRVRARTVARFPLVPHSLDELALLKRVGLIEIDLDGELHLTPRAADFLEAHAEPIRSTMDAVAFDELTVSASSVVAGTALAPSSARERPRAP